MDTRFDHEKLEVYRLELRFVQWVTPLLEEAKQNCGARTAEACDHLDRASLSALLNTAEGNGKRIGRSRYKFFDDARGSATECAACLDALAAKGAVPLDRIAEGKHLLLRIVQMLSRLVMLSESPGTVREADPTYAFDYDHDHEDDHDRRGQLIFILGGARSGKSVFAQRLAASRGERVTYLATAGPSDEEMAGRIARHREERPVGWRTVECPLDPAAAIRAHAADTDCFLLDCLTLLVSNLLLADESWDDAPAWSAIEALIAAHQERDADLILVSNEVGQGLVPDNPLGRLYRDLLGCVNQRLAARADAVYYLVAGLPLEVKSLASSLLPREGKSP